MTWRAGVGTLGIVRLGGVLCPGVAVPNNLAYGRAYRKARAELLAGGPRCHWQGPKCTGLATTADHNPPLEQVRRPHLSLVPACAACNYGRVNKTRPTGIVNSSGRW